MTDQPTEGEGGAVDYETVATIYKGQLTAERERKERASARVFEVLERLAEVEAQLAEARKALRELRTAAALYLGGNVTTSTRLSAALDKADAALPDSEEGK